MDHHTKLATKTAKLATKPANNRKNAPKLATNFLKLATKPAQIRKTGAKLATKTANSVTKPYHLRQTGAKLGAKAPKLVAKAPKLATSSAKLATKKRGPEMLGATRPKSGVQPGGFAPSTRKGDGLGWEEMSEQAGRSLRRFIERSQGRGVNASR